MGLWARRRPGPEGAHLYLLIILYVVAKVVIAYCTKPYVYTNKVIVDTAYCFMPELFRSISEK
jgi:hypothetical protein